MSELSDAENSELELGLGAFGADGDLDDDFDDNQDIEFHLYEHKNAPAFAQTGEVKAYHTRDDSLELYADRRSDYKVSFQRLLWVDGHEKIQQMSIDAETKKKVKKEVKREATLVVLKMLLSSLAPDQKFEWITATLSFEDAAEGGKDHPEVQAWAPFRKPERTNAVVGHLEKGIKVDAGVKGGYGGAELSLGASRESKISWDQTFFDEGYAEETTKDDKRNGVMWFMKHNKLQDQGRRREVWLSALFSRSSDAPYLVNFNFYTHAGTVERRLEKPLSFLGLDRGRTKQYSVKPWKKTVCKYEGQQILQSIDLDNLGLLRGQDDDTRLDVKWGVDYRISTPVAPTSEKTPGAAEGGCAKAAEAAVGETGPEIPAAVLPAVSGQSRSEPTRANPVPKEGLGQMHSESSKGRLPRSETRLPTRSPIGEGATYGPLTGLYHPGLGVDAGVDHTRLLALECRLAQAETRMAAQEMMVIQLQRELMAKDAQLTRLEQVFDELASR